MGSYCITYVVNRGCSRCTMVDAKSREDAICKINDSHRDQELYIKSVMNCD